MSDSFIHRLAQATYIPGALDANSRFLNRTTPWYAYRKNSRISRMDMEHTLQVAVDCGITCDISRAFALSRGTVVLIKPSVSLETVLRANLNHGDTVLYSPGCAGAYVATGYQVAIGDALRFWEDLYQDYEFIRSKLL